MGWYHVSLAEFSIMAHDSIWELKFKTKQEYEKEIYNLELRVNNADYRQITVKLSDFTILEEEDGYLCVRFDTVKAYKVLFEYIINNKPIHKYRLELHVPNEYDSYNLYVQKMNKDEIVMTTDIKKFISVDIDWLIQNYTILSKYRISPYIIQ